MPGEPGYINPASPQLTKLWANGFTGGHTYTDVYIIGTSNFAPSFVINMPLSNAKQLHNLLGGLIEVYEKRTQSDIMSLEKIIGLMEESNHLVNPDNTSNKAAMASTGEDE